MYVIMRDEMNVPLKVFSSKDSIEAGCIEQMVTVARLKNTFRHLALMPDGHVGMGASIGSVVATKGVIIPSLVGVDIGCGMCAVKLSITDIDTDTLKIAMGKIREAVPLGFNHQKEEQAWDGFNEAPDIQIIQANLQSARKQLGTLGAGNHFLESQRGDDGHIWLMLHSGSRNFGLKIAGVYHKKAMELCERWQSDIPDKELSFLPIESREGHEYYDAMNYCLRFAQANRALMMRRMVEAFNDVAGATVEWEVNIHHNYAAFEHHYGKDVLIHRKGATKAVAGLVGIIPGSMGTNSYIVEGLGNKESFESCSHGAGRRMGRKDAKRSLSLEEEQAKMSGIVNGIRTIDDLDEAPGAYKSIDEVMANQSDLVRIKVKLSPLGGIKG